MVNGHDEEGSTSSTLCDDSDKAGVNRAEIVVVDTPGDGDSIIAVIFGGSLTKDVPELGAAILRMP